MKKLLIATTTLAVATSAYAQEVTLTGALDADFTTEGFESGDVDVNTLSMVAKYTADNSGVTLTYAVLTSDYKDAVIADYNVYATTLIGKFSIGTNSGTTTDDDLAETTQAVDFTLGSDDLTDTYNGQPLGSDACSGIAAGGGSTTCAGSVWDTGDGPVDNGALEVAKSNTDPSMSYTSPLLAGLTFGITWASKQ